MASRVPARAELGEKVYVAVGREPEQSRATLLWAAQTISREQKIVLAHVHRPARMIPTSLDSDGPKLPAFLINKKELRRYRLVERERLQKCLDDYLVMCSQLQIQPEQVVIQMDDVAKGLLDLIARFGITSLVLGAAADKHYFEKMVMPKSMTAINVKRRADPSCNIWFVCKGHLICTRYICSSFTKKAREAENLSAKETRQRKEIEETLTRGRQETETLKNQLDVIFEQLKMANEQKLKLDLRIADSDIIKDIGEKLSQAQHVLSSLLGEQETLRQDRDAAVREAEKLRIRDQVRTSTHERSYSEFSYLELEQATRGFCDLLKLEEGCDRTVYKGLLRNTTVTIKFLNAQSQRCHSEFYQELDILSRVRHPNVVTLIGACTEACALIYEFHPHGSLEDHLSCKNNKRPLTWLVRSRIAAEICSALIFIHSHRPHPLVHGNLRPDKVLLDANFTSKLSSIGSGRLFAQSNTTSPSSDPHMEYESGYICPKFLNTEELTPQLDIYSLGITIIHLLTGRSSFGIDQEVKKALDEGHLSKMLDASAGDWPFIQAKQLAYLGLRCTEPNGKDCVDLSREVWPVLERIWKSAASTSTLSFDSFLNDNSLIPSYFICPILQEIMRDPQVAADGYTYEAEALNGWLGSGHNTSPMTNLKLPHRNLVPNHALRSAIQEWMQQQK